MGREGERAEESAYVLVGDNSIEVYAVCPEERQKQGQVARLTANVMLPGEKA